MEKKVGKAFARMKTYRRLYDTICSLENLYLAARKARRLKSRKRYVEDFALYRERILHGLREELLDRSYLPGKYREFRIYDPKERLICAAPYRDRVIHHALCNVLGPIIERRFVADSYSCQRGKGTLAAMERCRQYTNKFRWVLKCDVRKFFQSVDHGILMRKLERIIHCDDTLELCRRIIDSFNDTEAPVLVFAGDDLFTGASRLRGLPIGNLTSQLWGNFYLDEMDHLIKERLGAVGYARYTDDWLMWADDKARLMHMRDSITTYLGEIRLALNERKTSIMKTVYGVPFLGFRFFPSGRPHVLSCTKRRFERRTRRQQWAVSIGRLSSAGLATSVTGWRRFSEYGNVTGLWRTYRRNGFGRAGTCRGAGLAGRVLEQQQSGQSALLEPQQQRS